MGHYSETPTVWKMLDWNLICLMARYQIKQQLTAPKANFYKNTSGFSIQLGIFLTIGGFRFCIALLRVSSTNDRASFISSVMFYIGMNIYISKSVSYILFSKKQQLHWNYFIYSAQVWVHTYMLIIPFGYENILLSKFYWLLIPGDSEGCMKRTQGLEWSPDGAG